MADLNGEQMMLAVSLTVGVWHVAGVVALAYLSMLALLNRKINKVSKLKDVGSPFCLTQVRPSKSHFSDSEIRGMLEGVRGLFYGSNDLTSLNPAEFALMRAFHAWWSPQKSGAELNLFSWDSDGFIAQFREFEGTREFAQCIAPKA